METHEAALHAAQAAQSAAIENRDAVRELRELLAPDEASWDTVTLTAAQPYVESSPPQLRRPTRSFGIYNPSQLPVYAGVGGASPQRSSKAPEFPPMSLVILPIMVGLIELGIDPADQPQLANGDVVIYLMRFQTVQAAAMGIR